MSWRARAAVAAAVPLLAAGAAVAAAGPVLAGAPYSCTTSAAMGVCPTSGAYTSYAGFSDFSSLWNSGSPYVDANEWGAVSGQTQTVNANSPGDWDVVENIPSGSNPSGAVTTYPNAGMDLNNPAISSLADITSSFADTIPSASGNSGWQGYDLWFNNWGDEEMIQTQWVGAAPCTYVAVQQFGGSGGVPVQTWGLCDFGGPGGEKVWKLAPSGTQVGGSATINEASGSVDITAMTDWLVNNGYMLTSTPASTTVTALSAGFEICETPSGGSTWTYTSLTFNLGGSGGTQQAPAATTNAATGVTSSGATLNGSVNPEGADASYQFDYGTTASYGSSTTAGDAGSGTSAVNESANLTGLQPSTTYHYRVEATNSGGTSYGSDQTFTTSASGGGGGTGAVTYDATGSAKAANASSLSWTHTVGSGTDRALLVEATVGTSSDSGCAVTVTDNGTSLTKLDTVHTDNQTAGFLTIWGLVNPPSGANAIAVHVSGCSGGTPAELTGGSESFAGVSQSAPFSAVTNATGASGNPTAAITTPSSDLTTAFAANGSAIGTLAQGGKSRFTVNQDNNSGAGNSAGGTAGTGTVHIGWNTTSDWWAEGILSVQHD